MLNRTTPEIQPEIEDPNHRKWDLVGYSGGSTGLENAVKRWGRFVFLFTSM